MNFAILTRSAAASLLVLTILDSAAITLGAARGGALIGRALDWSVPVQLDANEDGSSLCAEADVSYADTRIDPSRVTVRTVTGPEKGQVTLRVTSVATVDEPVVTVVLRVGCVVKNTRRFVLLADLPTDMPSERSPQASPPVGVNPFAASGRTESARPGGVGAPEPSTRPNFSVQGSTLRQPAPRARQAPVSRSANTTVGSGSLRSGSGGGLAQSLRLGQSTPARSLGSRLQLDSADLFAETSPALKSATQLQGLPLENEPRRVEYAAIWRALNMRTEEVSLELQRLGELQSESRNLRDSATRAQTELGAVRQQLKKAEEARFNNPLVYALAALLFLLIIGAIYMRHRMLSGHGGRIWWDEKEPASRPADLGRDKFLAGSDHPAWQAESRPDSVIEPASRSFPAAPPSARKQPESSFLPSTLQASPRGVNVHELFDIAQQADFFVSLGQHDHAIEVLLNHIRESTQTSPLPYLDLFRLYHDTGRRAEYDGLRSEFHRIFNAELPPFDAFRESGVGLETYEATMTRIQSLWNTSGVLDVIEESIFRKPGLSTESFGLEAYRELLLLYSIANDLLEPDHENARDASPEAASIAAHVAASPGPRRSTPVQVRVPEVFMPTSPQPLSVSQVRGGGNYVPLNTSSPSSGRSRQGVGLDIDLSNPLLGYRSSTQGEALTASRLRQADIPSKGSGWLEFDLGKLEDDSTPDVQVGKPPKK
jgi:pilus assembly protein FimV